MCCDFGWHMKFYEIPRPFGQDISYADREQQQEHQEHTEKNMFPSWNFSEIISIQLSFQSLEAF